MAYVLGVYRSLMSAERVARKRGMAMRTVSWPRQAGDISASLPSLYLEYRHFEIVEKRYKALKMAKSTSL